MQNPVLTILYQMDPLNVSIGGIQTTILNFIKYAPNDFDLRLIGISSRKDCEVGEWEDIQIDQKNIQFLPLFYIDDDNIRSFIPTTVKYALTLFLRKFNSNSHRDSRSDFFHFHRIEPSIASLNWPGNKSLFIHADIRKQVNGAGGNHTILWRYFPFAYFAIERFLLKQFSTVFSCNSESLKYLKESYPSNSDRFKLIRNTVDNDVFFPLSDSEKYTEKHSLIKRMKLPDAAKFITFVGRLHPQKDPLLLVRSVALLNQPDIHLFIIGEGELKESIQAEIETLNLTHQVSLLGGMQPKEIAEYLKVSELLILTSVYEGLPMVVLEALACGIPIITTEAGETPLLLSQETGVVSYERTPEAVAHALTLILGNSDQCFSSEACVQASQPYWAKVVVSEIYNEMRVQWQEQQKSPKDIYSTV